MYCSNCGLELSNSDKFCCKCGASNKNYLETVVNVKLNKSENENLIAKNITRPITEAVKIKKKLKGLFALFIYCNLFILPLKIVAIFLHTEVAVTGNVLFDAYNIIYSFVLFFACLFVVKGDENIKRLGVQVIKFCLVLDLCSYILFIVFDLQYQEIDIFIKIAKLCMVFIPFFWMAYFWISKNVQSYIEEI